MTYARSVLVRTVLFAALWWVLIEGNLSYTVYALVAVPAAVALSLTLAPPRAGRWTRIPARILAAGSLAGWVVYRALLGGTDVALRAINRSPGGRTNPQVVTVPMRLTGTARAFALGTFNLMPGTLVQGTVEGAQAPEPGPGAHTVSRAKGQVHDDSSGSNVECPAGSDLAVIHVLAPEFNAADSWADLEERVAAVVDQKLR